MNKENEMERIALEICSGCGNRKLYCKANDNCYKMAGWGHYAGRWVGPGVFVEEFPNRKAQDLTYEGGQAFAEETLLKGINTFGALQTELSTVIHDNLGSPTDHFGDGYWDFLKASGEVLDSEYISSAQFSLPDRSAETKGLKVMAQTECPVCGGERVQGCRCASRIHGNLSTEPARIAAMQKGHGSQCTNGHRWICSTVITVKEAQGNLPQEGNKVEDKSGGRGIIIKVTPNPDDAQYPPFIYIKWNTGTFSGREQMVVDELEDVGIKVVDEYTPNPKFDLILANRKAQATEEEQEFAAAMAAQIADYAGDEKDVGQLVELIKGKAFGKVSNHWAKMLTEDCPGCGMKKGACKGIISCYRSVAISNRRDHKPPQILPGDLVKVLSSRDAVYGNVMARSIGGTKYGDVRVRVIKSNKDVSDNYPVGGILAVYADDLEKIANAKESGRRAQNILQDIAVRHGVDIGVVQSLEKGVNSWDANAFPVDYQAQELSIDSNTVRAIMDDISMDYYGTRYFQAQRQAQSLDEAQVGNRVHSVTGPGDFPTEGLSSRSGNIVSREENKWGKYLVVEFDDGTTDTIHGFTTTGIGWYLDKGE